MNFDNNEKSWSEKGLIAHRTYFDHIQSSMQIIVRNQTTAEQPLAIWGAVIS